MELGICCGRPSEAQARVLVDAGCDYYEPSIAGAVMSRDRADFDASLTDWVVSGLAPRSANVFLPGDLAVVGAAVDEGRLEIYAREALRRLEVLGIERAVFGSGAARNVPDGFSRDHARRQLGAFLARVAALGSPEVVVCLEHLRRAETNIVNSLQEAGELVEAIGAEQLGLVVDGYHLEEEDEDPKVVRRFAALVRHVHVCGSGRTPPAASDAKRLAELFDELAGVGYVGRCSIECRWTEIVAEAPAALDVVREAARATGLM